jgi:hypothetical protein
LWAGFAHKDIVYSGTGIVAIRKTVLQKKSIFAPKFFIKKAECKKNYISSSCY